MKSRLSALAISGTVLFLASPEATAQSELLTLYALNVQRLMPADRIGLRNAEPLEIAAVAELICEVHADRPRCGSYCTSDRRDRRDISDHSDTVMNEVDCWDTARILVYGSVDYQVPLDEVLATAYQESHFRRYALGNGSECGMFQQTTHRIRWSSDEVDNMGRAPFEESEDICGYLLQPENAMWHFALKYRHERAQSGENWSAYYNGGVNMWGYQQRHEGYRERFGLFLEDYLLTNGEDGPVEARN
ncbi:MAG: hypothetical protein ACJAYU_001018 [Bradymonadia bacterium]|jgi:hypothetical protein